MSTWRIHLIIDQYTGEPTAPELAKFILSRIVKNQSGVEQMEKELDSNERLVSEIVYFFIDIGWVRRNINGTYAITTKCKNVIERIETETHINNTICN
jgi:hypothetical protein